MRICQVTPALRATRAFLEPLYRARSLALRDPQLRANVLATRSRFGDPSETSLDQWWERYAPAIGSRVSLEHFGFEHLELLVSTKCSAEVISEQAYELMGSLIAKRSRDDGIRKNDCAEMLRETPEEIVIRTRVDYVWSNVDAAIREVVSGKVRDPLPSNKAMNRMLDYFEIDEKIGSGTINANYVERLERAYIEAGKPFPFFPRSRNSTGALPDRYRRLSVFRKKTKAFIRDAACGTLI